MRSDASLSDVGNSKQEGVNGSREDGVSVSLYDDELELDARTLGSFTSNGAEGELAGKFA